MAFEIPQWFSHFKHFGFIGGFFSDQHSPLMGSDYIVSTPAGSPDSRPGMADVDPNDLILREEVIDSRNRLCGYRFVPATLAAGNKIPEPLFYQALLDTGIVKFAQRRTAIVPVTPEGLVLRRYRSLWASNAFLLIDVRDAEMRDEELLAHLSAIREFGCRTALTGIVTASVDTPLLRAANMLILDSPADADPDFQSLVQALRINCPMLKLAAQGVQSWAERCRNKTWGIEYCLGDFVLAPPA
ncbi:hypothetical protein [Noviherbaspirillum massiliense]|uniref:hypothetical protein n=1 Tax=Noviherbaspirillum massiliense TaxID=1465823 RepID=UPI0002DDE392|nr:hypothetical protein [Noviherbaspirillum massiliense]